MMKVLVTGGAGFVGSHVVDFLVDKEYEVVIIDNLSFGKREYINPKAELYVRDINSDLNDVFEREKPDCVIHAAAQTQLRSSLEDPLGDAKINVLGTINILENCRKHGVKKIIYMSTGGARYGEPEYLPVDEKHQLSPVSPYGISKHTAEHYVWMYNQLHGIDYLIFCFGNVYGPRDIPENKRVIPLFINKMLRGESPIVFGDGKQTRDFIYVKDLAKFVVDSIDKNPRSKLFNLANGKQVSVIEIMENLKEIIGFEKEFIHSDSVKGEIRDIVL